MNRTTEDQRNAIREARKEEFSKYKSSAKVSSKIYKRKLHVDYFMCRGIYLLYYSEEVVYVGQSKTNMMKRICDHEAEGVKIFDSFKMLPCVYLDDFKLDKKEIDNIKRYSPKYNINHNTIDTKAECVHVYSHYNKNAISNMCSKCNKKIANKYYKQKDSVDKRRIRKHNKQQKYGDPI